jgi:hypothetical protein
MNMKDRLCVISTKNPTVVLLNTISAVQKYYPEFDIVIVDSDSTQKDMFQHVPSDVIIEYVQNKNWEFGAWRFAFQKYNYKVYMFLQDSFTPISRIPTLDRYYFPYGTIYFYHYNTTFRDGGHLDEIQNIYEHTHLHFLSELDPSTPIVVMAHNSFITNRANVPNILQLDDPYLQKKIVKTKQHSMLNERIGGILANVYKNKTIDFSFHFKKINLHRDY